MDTSEILVFKVKFLCLMGESLMLQLHCCNEHECNYSSQWENVLSYIECYNCTRIRMINEYECNYCVQWENVLFYILYSTLFLTENECKYCF